jgi:AraC-like DNA-binding protein
MPQVNYISKSGIFFACTEKKYMSIEDTVPEHAVIHVYSGSMTITDATKTHTANEGDTILLNRHLLAKFTKHPSETAQFKSVAILFSQPFLQKFYSTNKISSDIKPKWEVMGLNKHPLIQSLFDSILPYYELHENGIPSHLTEIKLQEAMTILRAIDSGVDSLLANFAEPGKIDLADFIMKNFHFNIPLERFAHLTGRSLATFKRDFQKAFNEPPQKWLLQKRLKRAHYLMAEKLLKPTDVYLEVGFENLSHFSNSFRQLFGYSPSSLSVSR